MPFLYSQLLLLLLLLSPLLLLLLLLLLLTMWLLWTSMIGSKDRAALLEVYLGQCSMGGDYHHFSWSRMKDWDYELNRKD
jgi:hypothetical protein